MTRSAGFSLRQLVRYNDPNSLGSKLRRRRSEKIRQIIDGISARKGQVKILDLGGRQSYWNIFPKGYLAERGVEITLVNFEAEIASAAGSSMFRSMVADACNLVELSDASFDMVHSNSVIEHVGDWVRMEAFAKEAMRLADSYFIQTPYFWFPIEPHFLCPFFHWLPEQWRAKLLMRRKLGHFSKAKDVGEAMRSVQSARLLDYAQMKNLFPNADIRFEWLGPIPKSIIVSKQSAPG